MIYASHEYLSLYLEADTVPSFSKLWKPAAISGTLYIPCPPVRSLKDSPVGSSGNRMRVTTAILALSLELFMRSRECRKSKQLFSSYSRRGYSGSHSFSRSESNLQRFRAVLNMHEEHP